MANTVLLPKLPCATGMIPSAEYLIVRCTDVQMYRPSALLVRGVPRFIRTIPY